MKIYKEKIDPNFFGNLENHLDWISKLKGARDGLMHDDHYFVFTTTKQGELGYDIIHDPVQSWGSDTVKGIFIDIQTIIDNLTSLMEYLYTDLPKKSTLL